MIKSPEERLESEFWINRYGKIIRYKPYEGENIEDVVSFHTSIARQNFPKVYHGNAEKACEDSGWVKVVCCLTKYPSIHKKPTNSQINTLFDLGYKALAYNNEIYKIQ